MDEDAAPSLALRLVDDGGMVKDEGVLTLVAVSFCERLHDLIAKFRQDRIALRLVRKNQLSST